MKDASLVIVPNNAHEILLVKRRDVPVWVLPGGGIEDGETAELAALRETFEETGLHVTLKKKVATYFPVNRLTRTTHLFESTLIEDTNGLSHDLNEVSSIGFFPINDLPSSLFPLHQIFIQEWRAKKHYFERPLRETEYHRLFHFLFAHPLWILRYFWTRLTKN